jgi:hypothetical protein
MPQKKSNKKKSGKRKSASRKKANLRKKPIQRKKPTHPEMPRVISSAQIHQGVGPDVASQSETAREFPQSDAEYGEES